MWQLERERKESIFDLILQQEVDSYYHQQWNQKKWSNLDNRTTTPGINVAAVMSFKTEKRSKLTHY